MKGARQLPPTAVRLPEPLRKTLAHAAIDNRRSLSGEILFRLEQSLRRETDAAPQAAQQQ